MTKEELEAAPFRPGDNHKRAAWKEKLRVSKRKRDDEHKTQEINLAFEKWWEDQGLDGEQRRAREFDRYTLARMAFEGGIQSCVRPRKGAR